MKIKAIFILSVVLFVTSFTKTLAQQDPNYLFYRYTMNLINPAFAGAEAGSEFGLNIRSQ